MTKHCRYKMMEIEKGILKEMLKENEETTIFNKIDKKDKINEKINELNERIYKNLNKIEQDQAQIKAKIESIEDPTIQKIFYLKYIESKTWEEIAGIIYYSPIHTQRIFKKACDSPTIASIKKLWSKLAKT